MIKVISKVFIGRRIQEEVFKMNISLNELSDRMCSDEKKILLLFQQKTMDLYLLYRWSCVVGFDFFSLFSEILYENDEELKSETILHFQKFSHQKRFVYEDKL